MSLKSFVRLKDVRERLDAQLRIPSPGNQRELLAPQVCRNASLVGTAFDYLLRFRAEKLNHATRAEWVAERAVRERGGPAARVDGLHYRRRFSRIVDKARDILDRYIFKDEVDAELFRAALWLAQLDVLGRTLKDSSEQEVGKTDANDVRDLQKLYAVVPPKLFKARKVCVLNPSFGRASDLVYGADADLVIDDALIEIKTVRHFRVEPDYVRQLIGYWILSRIGGITGSPWGHEVKRLGIYFSRYAYLWLFHVSTVIEAKQLPCLIAWFEKRAAQEFWGRRA